MIKIRAWDNELKKMLYSKQEQFDDSLLFRFDQHFETENPIYMLYTGFQDLNDNDVYDQDILQEEDGFLWVVHFENGIWYVTGGEHEMTESLYEFYDRSNPSKLTVSVIGNTYANPSFL